MNAALATTNTIDDAKFPKEQASSLLHGTMTAALQGFPLAHTCRHANH